MEFINANDLPAAGAMGTDNKVIVQQGDKFVLMTLAELLDYMASANVETDPTLSLEGVAAEALATGTAIENLKKSGRAVNLLDNSDFTNPVNQRGNTQYTELGYTIDRWRTYSTGETVTIQNGYINKTGNLLQYVSGLDPNKVYTAAVCLNDGTIDVFSRVLSSGVGGWGFLMYAQYSESTGLTSFRLTSNAVDVKWAALYEGEYTAETLPEYQPKGYTAELAECMRYFINKVGPGTTGFYLANSNQFRVLIPTPVPMRVKPTVSMISKDSVVSNVSGATTAATVTAAAVSDVYNNGVFVTLTTDSTPGSYATGVLYSGFDMELSADL